MTQTNKTKTPFTYNISPELNLESRNFKISIYMVVVVKRGFIKCDIKKSRIFQNQINKTIKTY